MPDIQSALQAALAQTASAWASDDVAHQNIQPPQDGRITNNVSRVVFDLVKRTSGTLTKEEILSKLTNNGYKKSSVASLLSQMLRTDMVKVDSNGFLRPNQPEYTPIKNVKKKRLAKPVKVSKAAPKAAYTQGIYQLKPELDAVPEWTPNDVIDGLTVRQALVLFKELRDIFGG